MATAAHFPALSAAAKSALLVVAARFLGCFCSWSFTIERWWNSCTIASGRCAAGSHVLVAESHPCHFTR
jgi:hypothetical protein